MQMRLIELHEQRGRLLERVAVQRRTLAQQVEPLQGALNFSNHLTQFVAEGKAYLQQNPMVVAAVLVALVVFRPRTAFRWARRGLLAWRALRSAHLLMPGFLLGKLRKLF